MTVIHAVLGFIFFIGIAIMLISAGLAIGGDYNDD